MQEMRMKRTIGLILYLWQLPQNLVGLLLVSIYAPEVSFPWRDVRLFYSKRMRGGISLGRYIIVSDYFQEIGKQEKHEYGHCRQSMMLGPLYLPVVGLPSLLWAAFYRPKATDPNGYFRFYTEKWADRLGGVRR